MNWIPALVVGAALVVTICVVGLLCWSALWGISKKLVDIEAMLEEKEDPRLTELEIESEFIEKLEKRRKDTNV